MSGETPEHEIQLDAFAVDVRELLSRTVASLYSHLITRPTGRAVRMAIEAQLGELEGPTLSLVDFSSVSVLDYSCADEVVAKLLLGIREGDPVEGEFFVLFRGLRAFHRDPVMEVLERYDLHAVVESEGSAVELLGPAAPAERALWARVEDQGRIPASDLEDTLDPEDRDALHRLLRSRSLFRDPYRGDLYALTELARLLDP